MDITTQQRIELMQLAKAIASEENEPNFARRVGWPDIPGNNGTQTPPTRMEITLHIYRQLLSGLMSSEQ